MQTANIRSLKTSLEKYISLVKSGEEVVLVERGRAVLRMIRVPREQDWRKQLAPLAARGLVRLPTKISKRPAGKPIVAKDKPLSDGKKGEETMPTKHDKPGAAVQEPKQTESWRERLAPLAAEGLVILPTKGPRKRPFKPIKAKGKLASEMIMEDRR